MFARTIRTALLLCALMLAPAAGAQAASLWTPLSSGTTEGIAAIATPKAGEIVYATSAGQIYYFTGTGFAQASVSLATIFAFTSVAFSGDGVDGVAVGQDGNIYSSDDSGHSWTADARPTEYTSGYCGGWTDPQPLSDNLTSVRFVPASTKVFVTGPDNDVLESTDNGAHFTEVNKSAGGCVADSDDAFDDTQWLTSSIGFLVSTQFGALYRTTDGFAGTAGGTTKLTTYVVINTFATPIKLAVDSGNPSDIWEAGGSGSASGVAYSTDGGDTFNIGHFSTAETNALEDIANVGTTVVAVGESGDIWTSPDGRNFCQQDAGAPYSSTNWNAVSMIPGTNAAVVGGAGGALAITTQANQLPDKTPPTGHVSGPAKLAAGQFGSYTVSASDNAGGSGINSGSFRWSIPDHPAQSGTKATFAFSKPGSYLVTVSFTDLAGNPASAGVTIKVAAAAPSGSKLHTTSTGGATVGTYGKVKVSGSKSRYIPVKVAAKKQRPFVISLLTNSKKHRKTLAKMTITLQGKATVHLGIGKAVKSGTYLLQVQIYATGKHSKPIGRRIKQVFVLD